VLVQQLQFYIPRYRRPARRIVDPITKAVTLGGPLISPDPLQSNDYIYNACRGGTTRETPIQQELYRRTTSSPSMVRG
jgi:hypothetical protein